MSEARLDQLVGKWTYEGRSVRDKPKHRRTGKEIVTRRSAWVVIECDDDARCHEAFNPRTGRITGDFIHWQHPHLWTYEGAVEDGHLHLPSRGPSFDIEAEQADYEDVFKIISPDERR